MKESTTYYESERTNKKDLIREKINNNELTLRTINKTCRTLGELKQTLEKEVNMDHSTQFGFCNF